MFLKNPRWSLYHANKATIEFKIYKVYLPLPDVYYMQK